MEADDDIPFSDVEPEPPKREDDPYELWLEKYQPIDNKFLGMGEEGDPEGNHPYNGKMFETFGPELEFVLNTPEKRVWTLVDGDDSSTIITAGYHIVNRIGYFITDIPWIDEMEYCVVDEGYPNTPKGAANHIIDNTMNQEGVERWKRISQDQKINLIQPYLEQEGFNQPADEVALMVDKLLGINRE